jgi:hypothetical protein
MQVFICYKQQLIFNLNSLLMFKTTIAEVVIVSYFNDMFKTRTAMMSTVNLYFTSVYIQPQVHPFDANQCPLYFVTLNQLDFCNLDHPLKVLNTVNNLRRISSDTFYCNFISCVD